MIASVLQPLASSALRADKKLPNSLILAAGTVIDQHTFQLPGPRPRGSKVGRDPRQRDPQAWESSRVRDATAA